MIDFTDLTRLPLDALLDKKGFRCPCGRLHKVGVEEVVIEQGALTRTAGIMKNHGGTRPFLISDRNTYDAAGRRLCKLFDAGGIKYSSFIYPQQHITPDEFPVGQAAMNFEPDCDFIIAIGSGTLNDIGKMLAKTTGRRYMIVCTAPSMDGYASSTSSMIANGIKVTIDSTCPIAIVADAEILCRAPLRLLQAGLGDMLAKYISICEWRISHLINNEYYCENVAGLIRHSVEKCVNASRGLAARDPEAIIATMEGLVISGVAMSFAGCSRPASGIEHYFSHIWDMRNLYLQKHGDLHGIQTGVATLLAVRLYEFILQTKPDRRKAMEYVSGFNHGKWNDFLRSYLGKAGISMVQLEQIEGKYDRKKHTARLETIICNWQSILEIISQEIPEYGDVKAIIGSIGAPASPVEIGISGRDVPDSFLMTKDIRDKYMASRLLWDLGMLDEAAEILQ